MTDNWPYTASSQENQIRAGLLKWGGGRTQIVVCGNKHKMNVECVDSKYSHHLQDVSLPLHEKNST